MGNNNPKKGGHGQRHKNQTNKKYFAMLKSTNLLVAQKSTLKEKTREEIYFRPLKIPDSWKIEVQEKLLELDEEQFPWQNNIFEYLSHKFSSDNESLYQNDLFWFTYNFALKKERKMPKNLSSMIYKGSLKCKNSKYDWHKSGKFKASMYKIDEHLREVKHPLKQIIDLFTEWFIDNYYAYLERGKLDKSKVVQISNTATQHIQIFISILEVAIRKFYNITIMEDDLSRGMIHTVAQHRTLEQDLYTIIISLITSKNEEKISKLYARMKKLEKITLEKLKVKQYFTFNQNYRDKFVKKGIPRSRCLSVVGHNLGNSGNSGNLEFGAKKGEYMYYKQATRALLDIKHHMGPEKKLNQMSKVNQLITEGVDAFWKGYEVKQDKLSIDTDSLFGIYIFIVIKSQCPKLISEYEYAEAFMSDISRMSSKGYFLATLGVALEYVTDIIDVNIMDSTYTDNYKTNLNIIQEQNTSENTKLKATLARMTKSSFLNRLERRKTKHDLNDSKPNSFLDLGEYGANIPKTVTYKKSKTNTNKCPKFASIYGEKQSNTNTWRINPLRKTVDDVSEQGEEEKTILFQSFTTSSTGTICKQRAFSDSEFFGIYGKQLNIDTDGKSSVMARNDSFYQSTAYAKTSTLFSTVIGSAEADLEDLTSDYNYTMERFFSTNLSPKATLIEHNKPLAGFDEEYIYLDCSKDPDDVNPTE